MKTLDRPALAADPGAASAGCVVAAILQRYNRSHRSSIVDRSKQISSTINIRQSKFKKTCPPFAVFELLRMCVVCGLFDGLFENCRIGGEACYDNSSMSFKCAAVEQSDYIVEPETLAGYVAMLLSSHCLST